MNEQNRGSKRPEKFFDEDEMELRAVDKRWTEQECLAQEGVFFLKDIGKVVPLDPVKVKKKAGEIEARGEEPWAVMGARKIWNHWLVRMKVFAPYYREHFVSRIRKVDPAWTGNDLLEQEGSFALVDVCRLLPFSTHQLRYQAKRNPKSKQEFGIWKDEALNLFVVDMARFGPYIQSLWKGGLRNAKEKGKRP